MLINNNFNSSDRAFNIIVDHVASANNACKDLDIKKLQNYLKKHNGGSAEDYIKKKSYSFFKSWRSFHSALSLRLVSVIFKK